MRGISTYTGKVRALKTVSEDDSSLVSLTASSIILLVFAVVCSFAVSFSLDKLITAFDNRCILDANVKFQNVNESIPPYDFEGSSPFQDRIDRNETMHRLALQPVIMTKKFVTLSDFFNESYGKTLHDEFQTQVFPVEEVRFLIDSE